MKKHHLDKIIVLIKNVKYTVIQYVLYIYIYFSSYTIIFVKKWNDMYNIWKIK